MQRVVHARPPAPDFASLDSCHSDVPETFALLEAFVGAMPHTSLSFFAFPRAVQQIRVDHLLVR